MPSHSRVTPSRSVRIRKRRLSGPGLTTEPIPKSAPSRLAAEANRLFGDGPNSEEDLSDNELMCQIIAIIGNDPAAPFASSVVPQRGVCLPERGNLESLVFLRASRIGLDDCDRVRDK